MAVSIKSPSEILKMRESCKRLKEVHERLKEYVLPGVTTKELDRRAEELIRGLGGIPNFLNYDGFPGSICASVNDEVVHGFPTDRRLEEGDIISLDCGLIYDGYHSDAARTWGVGRIAENAEKLIRVTEESFFVGIREARAGNHLYDISGAIQDYVESYGYGIVRELTGHGIGTSLHEGPSIPNFRPNRMGRGIRLKAGMTLAIEPMVTEGHYDVRVEDNDWTYVTVDGSLASHYENTILITDGDPEILTL